VARIVLLIPALLCAGAAVRQFQTGRAGLLANPRTPEALREALRYAPDDPAKWRQLGLALIRAKSDSALPALETAVKLAPSDADALLGVAFESERLGRLSDADRFYIRAAESSRRFQPKYALAGFYLRRNSLDRFWPAASSAVNIPAADVSRILRLAHDTGADPNDIPSLLNLGTDHARAAYIAFAIRENHLDAAASVAVSLPPQEPYQPLLLQLCERLIQTGRTAPATTLWNRLPGLEKLNPAAGRSLTALQFGEPGTHGFHWRYTALPGTAARAGVGSGLRIEFSGRQPEHGPVLEKMAPVLSGRKYRLAVNYSTTDLHGPTGLAWTIAPFDTAPVATAVLAATAVGAATAEFTTPAGCTLLRIRLVYTRANGTVRIAGTVHLRSAALELLS
jgi:hypothetical protein